MYLFVIRRIKNDVLPSKRWCTNNDCMTYAYLYLTHDKIQPYYRTPIRKQICWYSTFQLQGIKVRGPKSLNLIDPF